MRWPRFSAGMSLARYSRLFLIRASCFGTVRLSSDCPNPGSNFLRRLRELHHSQSSTNEISSSSMIQRAFLRRSQAAKSFANCRSPHFPRSTRTPSPFDSALRTAQPISQRIAASRWYSSTAEADKKTEPEGGNSTASKEGGGAEKIGENSLQKELEIKNREIIDLKVCHSP